VGRYARTTAAVVLASLGSLLPPSFALAEDFSVDFGADTDRGRDAGTLHCRFDRTCDAKMESLGLTVRVHISRGNAASADIRMLSENPDCCYFADARSTGVIDTRTPLSRVPIFKGEGARGGLFIQNERLGVLYLKFQFP
jgi:hypothetical protein